MSLIKSFSVGNGDMFYIKHGNDNFTIIDCCLSDDNKIDYVNELIETSKSKSILRFISTHPDDDHICGLQYIDDEMKLLNFYCVNNEASKPDETKDFIRYCELRDSTKKAFYVHKGCSRKWMTMEGEDEYGYCRGSSGISILWPDISNKHFKEVLDKVIDGESPNNISPIIQYRLEDGVTALWMGDLEKEFMEKIINEVDFQKVNILFAPHHGRQSGKVPNEWIKEMNPDIVIMGEAPSNDLDYAGYDDYNKITQNSAGNIIFDCIEKKIHIYVSKRFYSVSFLDNEAMSSNYGCFYLGTLNL